MSDEHTVPADDVFAAAVEAILFAAGEPLHPKEIASALGERDEKKVEGALDLLKREHEERRGGLQVEQVAGGYRFATRQEIGAWVRRFFRQRNRTRLSPAALETLSVVAYRQPVTAPEIQAIRGVDPSAALKSLLEKKMVRILGRKKVVGNPLLYGTSRQFLMHFGLNTLEDLPSIEEFDRFLGVLDGAPDSLFPPARIEVLEGDAVDPAEPSPDERTGEPLDDV